MTKDEFKLPYRRLCAGFTHEPTPEQFEAWWEQVGRSHAGDWETAVKTLLCGIRYPLIDHAMAAVEKAQTARRHAEVIRDQAPAAQIEQGVSRNLNEWKERANVQLYHHRCETCGGDEHEERLCWPWLDEAERARRIRMRSKSSSAQVVERAMS